MNKGFYIGMKVTLDGEYGVVVKQVGGSEWDKEPGVIRWDSNNKNEEEDWRGLFGSFIDSGGKEIDSAHQFKYINDSGEFK